MKTLLTAFAICFASFSIGQNQPDVVLNELNMDNPGGPDQAEFIELYGNPGTSLDGFVLVLFEGSNDLSYGAFDLDGYSLNTNGFFVIGNAAVTNVDLIIADGTISNGADGVAIYQADATDFPIDTPPSQINLIDAAVYETGDATDQTLIAALGLDVIVPGYTQLDETAQQQGADLSISRTPDGGPAFDFGTWTLQEITPGTFNVAQCFAGDIELSTGGTFAQVCTESAESSVTLIEVDTLSFGENQIIVVADQNANINAVYTAANIDFSAFAPGTYFIYNIYFNGIVDSTTLSNEFPVSGITAGNCVSIGVNPVQVDVVNCSGCVGGTIASNIGDGSSYCAISIPQIQPSNNSTSNEDIYLYALTDSNGAIIDTFSMQYDAAGLQPGNYNLYGISHIGMLSGTDSITTIDAEVCLALSDNSIAFTILNCPYIVFNELNIDNPGGGDTEEFIEFYGTPLAQLDGLVLVLFEGDNNLSYESFDLDGFSLDENGFFVIGNAAVNNVDYIIADATIGNGPDAVGLYIGDAADFPNDTPPTTVNLIEAAVYGTDDPTDGALITALGLDNAVPGYEQLNETFQQNFPDLSMSRVPDGGLPYNFAPWILQQVTPGTWNEPQCLGGSIFSIGPTTFCDTETSMPVGFVIDSLGYGDALLFVITDQANTIITYTNETQFDFGGFASGSYRIYSVYFNGAIDSASVSEGNNLETIYAGNCVSVSTNFVGIELVPCTGCIAGEVALESDFFQFCNSTTLPVALSNTGTSLDDSYIYVLVDNGGAITTFGDSWIPVTDLIPGTYSIYGVSYQGVLTGISSGVAFDALSSDVCLAISTNAVEIEIFECSDNTPCTQLFISEYLEGTNGTKAIELFNPSLTPMNLAGYTLSQFANGIAAPTNVLNLSGSIGPLGTYVIANPGQGGGNGAASQTVLNLANLIDQIANFNGNDALELRYNGVLIDAIGIVGENPGTGSGWPVGNASTVDVDLVRKFTIQSPIPIWAISANQWDIYNNTDYSRLGNHLFQPCTDELLAGFLADELTVAENAGTLNLSVQCLNAATGITISMSVIGGTADASDYTLTLPITLNFTDSTAIQSFTLDIVNDAIPEGAETILLTLQSDSLVTWLQQTLTITITQSDPNCDGGFITGNGADIVSQCSDLPNAQLDLTSDNNTPNDTYVFVIADVNENILEIVNASPVSLDAYDAGTYYIFGLSYTGNLDPSSIEPGMPVAGIGADQCAELSNNIITIERAPCIVTGCDAGSVFINDGADFITICAGDNHVDVIFTNTGESIDDSYTYFIVDATGTIVGQVDSIWSAGAAADGEYTIYGVSYLNNLIDSTVVIGAPFSGIEADSCFEVSDNSIQAIAYSCNDSAPCTKLFFSEILEDSQSDKAIELYNPSALPLDLSNYTINLYTNGSAAPSATLNLSGSLPAHEVYVITSSGNGQNPTDPAILDVTDITSDVATFTGNDAIELLFQGTVIDMIGIIGDDPGGNGWEFGNASTANHVLVRRQEITSGNADWNIVSGQWISYDATDYTHLGSHQAFNCGNVPVAIVGFTTAAQTASEIDGTTVTVTIHSESVETPFQIVINESGSGTALIGEDYSAGFPITFTVPQGTSDLSFTITIIGDAITEGNETIDLDLNANANVFFNIPNQVITITEGNAIVESMTDEVSYFPNPATQSVTVLAEDAILALRIVDMSGRTAAMYTFLGQHKTLPVQIESLPNGFYIMELQTEKDRFYLPLQKVN